MGADIIQAQYDQLEALARRFGKQADLQAALQKRVQTRVGQLRTAWVGRGSDAFYTEMDAKVFPALARLIAALREAQKVTLQISEIVRQAEEEAARPLGMRGQLLAPQPAEAGLSPESDLAGAPPIQPPSPEVPARTEFQRLLDTVLALKPLLGELLLDKLGVGELADAVDLLQTEQRFDEIDRAGEAWEEAKRQYGSDSPQAQEAEVKYEDAFGNFPIVGPYIKALLDMAKANPVY
jgi:WXG100 family type VII secretion target